MTNTLTLSFSVLNRHVLTSGTRSTFFGTKSCGSVWEMTGFKHVVTLHPCLTFKKYTLLGYVICWSHVMQTASASFAEATGHLAWWDLNGLPVYILCKACWSTNVTSNVQKILFSHLTYLFKKTSLLGASEELQPPFTGLVWTESNMISSHPSLGLMPQEPVGISGVTCLTPPTTTICLDTRNRHIIYLSWGQRELLCKNLQAFQEIKVPQCKPRFPANTMQLFLKPQHTWCAHWEAQTSCACTQNHTRFKQRCT